jgi:hypothetical protein
MYIQFTIGTVISLYYTVKSHFLFFLTISFYLFSNLEKLKLMVRAGLVGYPGKQKCVCGHVFRAPCFVNCSSKNGIWPSSLHYHLIL